MTDQERITRLGDYIIKQQQRILVYEGVFMEYRVSTSHGPREIPFREDAKRIAQEEALIQIADERRRELRQGIEHESEPSALIRALYRQFVGED
jgi:hypothetical protein